jgi:hypothetical protein
VGLKTNLIGDGSSRAPDYDEEYLNEPSTRSIKIGNSTSSSATADNNQYKLVRDKHGIWFAFWQNLSEIFAANSTSSSGAIWNPEFKLIGSSGAAVDTSNNVDYASVAIHYDSASQKDEIHLICQYNTDDLLYSKLTNTNDFRNLTGNAWKVEDESRSGYELIDGNYGLNILQPTIAVNTSGKPHVVWTQSAFNTKVFYTRASSNQWSEPVILTNFSAIASGMATVETDGNDNIHLAWLNTTTREINYKRCLSSNNSTIRSNWKSADQLQEFDKVLFSTNSMHYPSMVADSNNNIWIVAHEVTVNDIWFNKCIDKNWSSPVTIASTDDLRYPTIGADENGNVHAVWLNITTDEVIYAFYGTSWSGNYSMIGAGAGTIYFPCIERHIRSGYDLSGVIFTNSTSKDISFEYAEDTIDIPEFSHYTVLLGICSIMIMFVLRIKINKRKFENEPQ